MYLILDTNNEVIGVSAAAHATFRSVLVPDNFVAVSRQATYLEDGTIQIIPGTILTEPQITRLTRLAEDKVSRKQKVAEEVAALVGQFAPGLSDANRWKLVGAVFYKLGVINAAGIIQPVSDWVVTEDEF